MKSRNILLALGLVLTLTGCSEDSYTSVRHPEGAGEEIVNENTKQNDDLADQVRDEQAENNDTNDKKEAESKPELTDGVEIRVSDVVNMRLAPSENSAIVSQVSPEDEILNLGETEGWTRVTVNGKTGYIRSDLLISN